MFTVRTDFPTSQRADCYHWEDGAYRDGPGSMSLAALSTRRRCNIFFGGTAHEPLPYDDQVGDGRGALCRPWLRRAARSLDVVGRRCARLLDRALADRVRWGDVSHGKKSARSGWGSSSSVEAIFCSLKFSPPTARATPSRS